MGICVERGKLQVVRWFERYHVPYTPQIIESEGSYSFLVIGLVVACLGFIAFIGLLFFHRMHRNYLTGTCFLTAHGELDMWSPNPIQILNPFSP